MIRALVGIDLRATANDTVWHRASAISKLALGALLVGLAIASPSLALLLAIHALAWMLALGSRLPASLLLGAAAYPLLLVLLFVIAAWDGTWRTPLFLVLRPLTASLTAVWLVGTTPYPDLFAPLARVLPRGAGDGLFLTYRALFALFARLDRLARALRLRGGAMSPRRRLEVVGQGLGTMVLHGFERSERVYATMVLRGHSGRVCGCRHWAETSRADFAVAAVGLLALAAAAIWWRG